MTNRDLTTRPKARSRPHAQQRDENVVSLSSGVKLKCKPVPQWLMIDILNMRNDEKPKVPKYYDERRKMELDNPDDADYQQALNDWTIKTGLL